MMKKVSKAEFEAWIHGYPGILTPSFHTICEPPQLQYRNELPGEVWGTGPLIAVETWNYYPNEPHTYAISERYTVRPGTELTSKPQPPAPPAESES